VESCLSSIGDKNADKNLFRYSQQSGVYKAMSYILADHYTVKNANRIPGFPWNLSFLIRENTHCGKGKILHIAHPGFFLFPVRKSVPGLEEVQKSGLGNEISRPTPQSWKHPEKFSEIPEIAWKFSEIPEISWKFSGSPKIAWTLANYLYSGPLSNRFMKIVNHTKNLYYF
jgi:hypothetical protein